MNGANKSDGASKGESVIPHEREENTAPIMLSTIFCNCKTIK